MTDHTSISEILLVEDNPGDVRLTQEAFNEAGFDVGLHTVTDGVEAMDFLRDETTPVPDIVLLDLSLPRKDGFDVLSEIRSDADLRHIPVLVLSSSTSNDDICSSYESYANAYLEKPSNSEEFVEVVEAIQAFWAQRVQLPPHP